MILHILFIAIYIFLDNVVQADPAFLNAAMIVHCSIALLGKLNNATRFVTPLTVFYLSGIIISWGNIIAVTQTTAEKSKINTYMIDQYIPDATLIWVVGASVIFMGYITMSQLSFPRIRLDITKATASSMFLYVLILSIFVSEIETFLSFLGSITKLLYLFGTIGILFYGRLWGETEDRKMRNYSFILFAVQTYHALMHSFLRSELLLPTVVLFAGYFVGKGHVKYLLSFRVLPFLAVFAIFISSFGLLGKYRSNFGAVISAEYLNNYQDDSWIPDNDALFDASEDDAQNGGFLERSADVAQLTNVVKLTREKGFYYGEASLPVLFALIPRFVWPDKPLVRLGSWFALETGTAQVIDGYVNNSINMTIMGESYMDFGWVGVALGCLLFGGFVAMMWNSIEFYSTSYNLMGVLFGGYILLLSFGIGVDFQLLVTYTSTYLMLFAIKQIVVNYF